jgi:hypothetical protein
MAEATVVLPKETMKVLTELTGETRTDVALTLMMCDYARQKLAETDASLCRYEEKYGMPFEAYKRIWDTEDRQEHYAHQVEWDYLEWESLVTRRKRLTGSLCQRIANE